MESAPPPRGYIAEVASVLRHTLTALARAPSHSRRAEAARRWARVMLALAAAIAVVLAALVMFVDVPEIRLMPPRGTASLWPIRVVTEFGKGAYVLWTLGGVLIVIVLLAARLRGVSRAVAIGIGTRLLYVFMAVLISVLVNEVIKGVVGRGRPFVGGEANALHFNPFAWTEAHASFASGHAVTAFSLAFAVAALWPRLRVAMAVYAIVIALTRLVLLAHHPSDVVAGALIGVIGAMAVRYWFAARRLAFTIRTDGVIEPLPGPSWSHAKKVARDAFRP